MKKFAPYIAFACLTTFAATSGLSVIAGGCSTHGNKTSEIKCAKNDTECQAEKNELFDPKEIVKS